MEQKWASRSKWTEMNGMELQGKKQTLYKLLCYTVRLALKLVELIQPDKWYKSMFIEIRIALQYI